VFAKELDHAKRLISTEDLRESFSRKWIKSKFDPSLKILGQVTPENTNSQFSMGQFGYNREVIFHGIFDTNVCLCPTLLTVLPL
jgi:hypothetical protein